MALLGSAANKKAKVDRETLRVYPVTTKLTKSERKAITEFARNRGIARGQWMRDAILRELRSGVAPDIVLAELLGVRLLLVNVLRPLSAGQTLGFEAFDKLLDNISSAKYELAEKLVTESRRS